MASNQDARPFIDLQKDAEEFKAKFEEDIEKCKNLLDSKITSLICDPDSLGNSVGPKQNALVEFSKAKYEVYISMKSFMNDLEREWLKYISEMKKLFLENVEIFLAGTKLEVKLPTSEYPPCTTRKSPGNKKSSTVGSSLYPIISSITKNIPVLSSAARNTEVQSRKSVQNSRGSLSSCVEMDFQVASDHNTSWEASRRKSITNKMSPSQVLPPKCLMSEDEDVQQSISTSFFGNARSRKSQSPRQNNQTLSNGNNASEEITENEQKDSLVILQPSLRGRGRQSRSSVLYKKANGLITKSASSSESIEEIDEIESESPTKTVIRASSRSKSAAGSVKSSVKTSDKKDSSTDSENIAPSFRGKKGKQSAKDASTKVTSVKNSNTSVSDENDDVKGSGNSIDPIVKSRRGRQTGKNLVVNIDDTLKKCINTSDENEDTTNLVNKDPLPPKSRRGRQAVKNQVNAEVVKNNTTTSDENEDGNVAENHTDPVPPKGRRGRPAAKKLATNIEVENPSNISDENQDVNNKAPIPVKGRRGRQVSKNEVNANAASKSHLKVADISEDSSSDDADDNEVLRNVTTRTGTKPSARRKTFVPVMMEIVPDEDIVTGNPSRARSKRKTMSSVSVVAPPKRLKSSSNQRSTIDPEEVASTANNLLEFDAGYSEWISLNNIDGKIPASPGIYEVKVWRAKKSAYIGFCDSLRQKLTLHKLKQNSGHKHLDKFIDRNFKDIQIRFEVVSSVNEAKNEVKNRVNNFVAEHKTTPAYN